MAIEAVISFWQRAGIFENDDVERVVARAAAAGFDFSAAEHRAALAVCEVLSSLRGDQTVPPKLKMGALVDRARELGHDLDHETIRAVLRALCSRNGELDSEDLDNVAGGVFLPEVDDEVLVAFEQGEARSPLVIGSLWGGKDKPPTGR